MSPVELNEAHHGGPALPTFAVHVLIEMKRYAACAVEQIDIGGLRFVDILARKMIREFSKIADGPPGDQALTLDQLNAGMRFALKLRIGIGQKARQRPVGHGHGSGLHWSL